MEQSEAEMTFEEGRNVTLSCALKTSDTTPYVYWYKQRPAHSPHYLLQVLGNIVLRNQGVTDRFSATFNKTAKMTEFMIRDPVMSDSALYICAMRRTLLQKCCRLEQKPTLCDPHERSPASALKQNGDILEK